MARTARQLVEQEVLVCTSQLVSMLAGGCAAITADNRDLVDLCEQAIELAGPVDDWEEAAIQEGWTGPHRDKFGARYFAQVSDGERVTWCAANWQDLCEEFNIDPYQREVFEHWAVTQWFGEKLAAHGEKVDFDFAGMIIWARTTTGQTISIDYVVEKIAEELNAPQVVRRAAGYTFWRDETGHYGVSKDGEPAPTHCAYASVEAIAKLKGIKL